MIDDDLIAAAASGNRADAAPSGPSQHDFAVWIDTLDSRDKSGWLVLGRVLPAGIR